jgi:hypothetical protein
MSLHVRDTSVRNVRHLRLQFSCCEAEIFVPHCTPRNVLLGSAYILLLNASLGLGDSFNSAHLKLVNYGLNNW